MISHGKTLMNRLSINAALMFVLSVRALTASAATSEALAQTPPMGWNSFDSYGVYLHEQAALANLEVMADKLLPCLLYTSPSPRDLSTSRMPSSA